MDLVRRKDFGLSGQILAEFAYQTSLKAKGRTPLPPHVVDQWFEVFGEATIAPVDVPIVQGGLALARRFQISYWDGAIIAAAERLGAPILYTEDLRHEQHYGAVQVINPLL
jgi:predicted nucleic acid-binding protein